MDSLIRIGYYHTPERALARPVQLQTGMDAGPRDHLANERTFLAWLRTAVSLISFGITINRFSLFLIESQPERRKTEGERLLPFLEMEKLGTGLVLFGTAVIVFGAWRYKRTYDLLMHGDYKPNVRMIWITTAAVVVFGGLATVWLFQL
jgi:putative membrane protein